MCKILVNTRATRVGAEHDEYRHEDMYSIERRLYYREHGKYSDED